MAMTDVPRPRAGKHKEIGTAILRDLDRLGESAALKVPLAELRAVCVNIYTYRARYLLKDYPLENRRLEMIVALNIRNSGRDSVDPRVVFPLTRSLSPPKMKKPVEIANTG